MCKFFLEGGDIFSLSDKISRLGNARQIFSLLFLVSSNTIVYDVTKKLE